MELDGVLDYDERLTAAGRHGSEVRNYYNELICGPRKSDSLISLDIVPCRTIYPCGCGSNLKTFCDHSDVVSILRRSRVSYPYK